MNVHLLGIRHHGVGSALRVKQALQALQPDLILIEGPQEFDAVIKHISAGAITPPVAILGYNADNPHQATFYPFAEFSPEWQALRFAEKHRIPTRMMDLPLRFTFQISENKGAVPARDPMSYLAEIEGFTNSEAWWESRFESSENEDNSDGHFDAVQMAMTALREAQLPSVLDEENLLREAWMRECLRTAAREMYREVAVVCGAWHVPALVGWSNSATADKAIIKSLPQQKMKIGATWVPWTNERLGLQSGYGAGIQAPGWSQFRWKYQEHTARNWLAAAAAVFRKRNIDISTAHVIDALQLANTLAIFRGRKQPLQTDLNEAITTVMCMGDEILLRWIQTELSVGKAMGEVPGNLPRLPLQIDFENTVKKLRIKLTDEETELVLDLREERNLQKSIFLHRVNALDLGWGTASSDDRAKGTFREIWTLEWRPEMMVELLAKGPWGNTVESAAKSWLIDSTGKAQTVAALTRLMDLSLLAELPDVTHILLDRLAAVTAVSSDISDLMSAIPPFARAMRYGNVRNTDKQAIENLLSGILDRVRIGLPYAVSQIDETAAQQFFEQILRVNEVISATEREDWQAYWLQALAGCNQGAHPLLSGCISRLLFEAGHNSAPLTAQLFGQALSPGNPPADAAFWIEGFLKGAGVTLLYDPVLWNLLFAWTDSLHEADFMTLLPVLRRTFSRFEVADRRRIGEKAKAGIAASHSQEEAPETDLMGAAFDEKWSENAMKTVQLLLG